MFYEDKSIWGSPFYIFLEGRVFYDPTLPELNIEERKAIYNSMVKILADSHLLDYKKLGLDSFGKEGSYVERQVYWTTQYRKSETKKILMERLIDLVTKNTPKDEKTTLVHGDYRIDNLIFHPNKPEVLGVIDWEISTLGNPFADFAYHAMIWRITKINLEA